MKKNLTFRSHDEAFQFFADRLSEQAKRIKVQDAQITAHRLLLNLLLNHLREDYVGLDQWGENLTGDLQNAPPDTVNEVRDLIAEIREITKEIEPQSPFEVIKGGKSDQID